MLDNLDPGKQHPCFAIALLRTLFVNDNMCLTQSARLHPIYPQLNCTRDGKVDTSSADDLPNPLDMPITISSHQYISNNNSHIDRSIHICISFFLFEFFSKQINIYVVMSCTERNVEVFILYDCYYFIYCVLNLFLIVCDVLHAAIVGLKK